MNQQENYLQQMLVTLRTRLLVMCASVGIALEEADKALEAAKALFTPGADSANVPSFALEAAHFSAEGTIPVIDVLTLAELCPSKSEARRAIQQGGVTVGEEKVTDLAAVLTQEEVKNGVMVRRGKKTFKKITLA